ncbi:MAG TPA: hypothetical protein VLH56_11180 [Dissulfurispiraceae bacterium]|nr:hypothetical protein [Dissulfurispiraceae bacterium]
MDRKAVREIMKPVTEADEVLRRVIERVFQLEREKLYQQKPRVIDDLLTIIKEEVR